MMINTINPWKGVILLSTVTVANVVQLFLSTIDRLTGLYALVSLRVLNDTTSKILPLTLPVHSGETSSK